LFKLAVVVVGFAESW